MCNKCILHNKRDAEYDVLNNLRCGNIHNMADKAQAVYKSQHVSLQMISERIIISNEEKSYKLPRNCSFYVDDNVVLVSEEYPSNF
jgi:hypothetical protein